METRRKKRLVVCCDGTWNQLGSQYYTNVVKTAQAVESYGDDGTPQLVFYDEGVGAGEGVTPHLDRAFGGALGWGLDRNIADAYRFLVFNYDPGDEIFVFGYSRGAYTARSLVGMVRKCGILRRGEAHRAGAALDYYRGEDKPMDPVDGRVPGWGHAAEVAFLGVWDTVGALGIPTTIPFSKLLNRRYRFHDAELSKIVKKACHAVAIDEIREAFQVTLWDNDPKPGQTIHQVWFPGDHGSVGGGTREHGLSDGAFLWTMQHAQESGLRLDQDCLDLAAQSVNPVEPFDNSLGKSGFLIGLAYRAVGRANRPPPPNEASIHESAATRWRRLSNYRPPPLQPFAGYLNGQAGASGKPVDLAAE